MKIVEFAFVVYPSPIWRVPERSMRAFLGSPAHILPSETTSSGSSTKSVLTRSELEMNRS